MTVYGGLILFAGLQVIAAQGVGEPLPQVPPECQQPPAGVTNPLACCDSPNIIDPQTFKDCGLLSREGPPPHPPNIGRSGGWDPEEAREFERDNIRRPRMFGNMPPGMRGNMPGMRGNMPGMRGNMPDMPGMPPMPRMQGRNRGQPPQFGDQDYRWRRQNIETADCTKQHCVLKKHNLLRNDDINHEAFQNLLNTYAEQHLEAKDVINKIHSKCFGRTLPGPSYVCEADKLFFCISTTFFYNCPTWKSNPQCDLVSQHLEKCKKYMDAV